MDPRNRNNVKCNLPPDELQALKELVWLQKERKIIIKPCDKGAGLMILNFNDYMQACYDHLYSSQSDEKGNCQRYYKQVDYSSLDEGKQQIKSLLQEGLDNNIITKEQFLEMDPDAKNPAHFYCLFKVHKEHARMSPPPVRPIITQSGSITENPGMFVEYYLNTYSK